MTNLKRLAALLPLSVLLITPAICGAEEHALRLQHISTWSSTLASLPAKRASEITASGLPISGASPNSPPRLKRSPPCGTWPRRWRRSSANNAR